MHSLDTLCSASETQEFRILECRDGISLAHSPDIAISRRLPQICLSGEVGRSLLSRDRAYERTSKIFLRANFAGHVRSQGRVKPSVNQYYGICMLFTREPPSTFVWIIPEINPVPIPPSIHPTRSVSDSPPPSPLVLVRGRHRGKQINGSSLSALCAATSSEERRARRPPRRAYASSIHVRI